MDERYLQASKKATGDWPGSYAKQQELKGRGTMSEVFKPSCLSQPWQPEHGIDVARIDHGFIRQLKQAARKRGLDVGCA